MIDGRCWAPLSMLRAVGPTEVPLARPAARVEMIHLKGTMATPGANASFRRFVATAAPPLLKQLPLVHVTEVFWGNQILASGEIETRDCPVFSEPLVYCFYGCARYRQKGDKPTNIYAWLPMAFVFQFDEKEHHLKRVFPFDTGAFKNGAFGNTFHAGMTMEEFELDPDISSAQRCVKAFFGTNLNYIDEKPLNDVRHPMSNLHADSYVSLITSPPTSTADHRRSAIEIQLDKGIKTASPKLVAMIVPERLLDDKDFVDSVKRGCGVDPTPYSVFGAVIDVTYGAMQHVVKTIVKDLCK